MIYSRVTGVKERCLICLMTEGVVGFGQNSRGSKRVFELQTIFTTGFPVAYLLLQVSALVFLKGVWQVAAVVLALSMAGALVLFLVGIALSVPVVSLPLAVGLPIVTLALGALWLAYGLARIGRPD